MNSSTKQFLEQIVEDRKLLNKKMIWEVDSYAMATLSAFLFASAGKRADVDRYVECKKYFKKTVNVFSELRGISEVIVITKMCLADNYQEFLAGVMEVYKKLRAAHKLSVSPYMVLAALNLYEGGGVEKADDNIAKLDAVYQEMKKDHFWLTGGEDRPFLSMLVSRDIDVSAIAAEIDACYEASKKMSFSKEAMHTSAQIMSLSGKQVETKVADLQATMTALKEHKVHGFKYELMPMATTLGLIDGSPELKAAEIKEICDYLKTQKGFKFAAGRTKRSLYAILAYAILNIDENKTVLNSVISTTLTTIIIQEIITLILISSSASSSSGSSSGGN